MMKKFLKIFSFCFLIFALMYSGLIFYFVNDDQAVGASSGNQTLTDKILNKFIKNDNELVFLLMGIDSKSVEEGEGQRTDTMMLCRYDDKTGKISILSIPRDTRAVIRGRNNKEKINHAHAYGGPEKAMKAVKDLLGVDVEYYVRVDYKIVKAVVDAIDGVEIDVPMRMYYNDPYADPPLHIDIKKGRQVLDGQKSLEYLRFRKGYNNQDLGRINAQQDFIKAAANKALELSISDYDKFFKIFKSYVDNVDTNIPNTVMLKYGAKAKDINLNNLRMETLPGDAKMINGLWYFIPYEKQSIKMVEEMFNKDEKLEDK